MSGDGVYQPEWRLPSKVLLKADGIYQWRGRKMGKTIFNVRRGTLVLTESFLAFVATGGSDVWWKIAWESAAFLPGGAGNVKTVYDAARTVGDWIEKKVGNEPAEPTFVLRESELLKDGSFIVPLQVLDEFDVIEFRQFGFSASYLRVSFVGADRMRKEFALSDKVHIPGKQIWSDTIRKARSALMNG
jgi:hypothetical protein